MSKLKRDIRRAFRDAVYSRDGYRCRVCASRQAPLDAHHITPRADLPCGGYVVENGITLCASCHRKAERIYEVGEPAPGYSPEELYALIGSSRETALQSCLDIARWDATPAAG